MRYGKKYRKRGAKYTISPYVLVYCDENYYLLAYDKTYRNIVIHVLWI